MIRLNPLRSEKIWGYEDWIASVHPNGCQAEFMEFAGKDYPLLVKVIQADSVLSVQVHPDDELAARFENCRGKTECWYVLSADEGAKLVFGMKPCSDDQIRKAIETDSLDGFMNYAEVKAGDFVYIPAGTVHAIGGGMRLMEVQQSSDITYRLYDWGRGRECHVEKGIACIKENAGNEIKPFAGKFSCPYFYLEEIPVSGEYEGSVLPESDSGATVLYYVLEGSGKVNGENAEAEAIFAFHGDEKISVSGSMRLMKILAL